MEPQVLAALITAGFALVGGLVVALISKHDRVATDIRMTREQVENSHSTNLRDDVDALHETARLTLRSVDMLREELHLERRERLAIADKFERHLERHEHDAA